MKCLLLLLCFVFAVRGSLEDQKTQWTAFKNKHGKLYTNLQEEKLRFSIFQQNLQEIEEHNKQYEMGLTTYKKEINKFADLTNEEFKSMLKRQSSRRPNIEKQNIYTKPVDAALPDSIDWREYGAVSKVKDQGVCGSCWAFSVTGAIESFYYLKNGKMVLLSEQQLVECSEENNGCAGGHEAPALEYVIEKGLQSEESYPYIQSDSVCLYNASAVIVTIKDYVQIGKGKEDELLSAVGLLGPVSIAMDASHLFLYKEGIYSDFYCSKKETNHAVLAVGYGKDEETGLDYWLVKNSWGDAWGQNGFFKIKRGNNECAIATEMNYPIL